MQDVYQDLDRLFANITRVILGKDEVVRLVLASLLSRGHVLLEDKPGVGKTMLARSIAASISCSFKRIQCTPDLLPVDVTGYNDPRTQEFKPGPVFANLVLADELNRTTPRTQSALLEAMGEGQVTVEGQTHLLPQPFMVLATQNPLEHHGVNDLPEAQMDRFQILVSPGYPSSAEELRMMQDRRVADPLTSLQPVMTLDRLQQIIAAVSSVRLDDALTAYVLALVRATRESPLLELGASPRSSLQLMRLSQAFALLSRRDFVIPDDIKRLALHCLPHRVVPAAAPTETISATQWKVKIVQDILRGVQPPAPGAAAA